MTCDSANGKLESLANNNNVTTQNDDKKLNGYAKLNGNGRVKVPKTLEEEEIASRKSLIILLTIFATSLAAMFYIYKNFPELEAWVESNLNFSSVNLTLEIFFKVGKGKSENSIWHWRREKTWSSVGSVQRSLLFRGHDGDLPPVLIVSKRKTYKKYFFAD
jgi:hypothetical protein